MTILTYHHNIGNHSNQILLRLFAHVWGRMGHDVVILNWSHVLEHPKFGDFNSRIKSFPSVNHREFEDHCYLRWLAVSQFTAEHPDKKFIFADYDVMPTDCWEGFPTCTGFTCFDKWGGPGFIAGRHKNFERVINILLSYSIAGFVEHVSDMTILHKKFESGEFLYDTTLDWVRCFTTKDWQFKPLTHFGNAYTPKGVPRHKSIMESMAEMKLTRLFDGFTP
jgi:hypothetical protein